MLSVFESQLQGLIMYTAHDVTSDIPLSDQQVINIEHRWSNILYCYDLHFHVLYSYAVSNIQRFKYLTLKSVSE